MWKVDSFTQKGQRRANEDRYDIRKVHNGYLVLICDGHMGSGDAADFVVQELPKGILSARKTSGLTAKIRNKFDAITQKTNHFACGTTATLVLVRDTGLSAAVLGDSLVLCGRGQHDIWVGPSHNVRSNTAERDASIGRGARYERGYIWAGEHGLQVSRSFGDSALAHILSREPEIVETDFSANNAWVAVMSDGVLDTTSTTFDADTQQFQSLVMHGASAKVIVEHFYPENMDDATLVLLRKM